MVKAGCLRKRISSTVSAGRLIAVMRAIVDKGWRRCCRGNRIEELGEEFVAWRYLPHCQSLQGGSRMSAYICRSVTVHGLSAENYPFRPLHQEINERKRHDYRGHPKEPIDRAPSGRGVTVQIAMIATARTTSKGRAWGHVRLITVVRAAHRSEPHEQTEFVQQLSMRQK